MHSEQNAICANTNIIYIHQTVGRFGCCSMCARLYWCPARFFARCGATGSPGNTRLFWKQRRRRTLGRYWLVFVCSAVTRNILSAAWKVAAKRLCRPREKLDDVWSERRERRHFYCSLFKKWDDVVWHSPSWAWIWYLLRGHLSFSHSQTGRRRQAALCAGSRSILIWAGWNGAREDNNIF